MLDRLKELGFLYATKAGVSIGISDMVIPSVKFKLVEAAEHEVVKVQQQYLDGAITNGERYNKVIAIWWTSPKTLPTKCSRPSRSRIRKA